MNVIFESVDGWGDSKSPYVNISVYTKGYRHIFPLYFYGGEATNLVGLFKKSNNELEIRKYFHTANQAMTDATVSGGTREWFDKAKVEDFTLFDTKEERPIIESDYQWFRPPLKAHSIIGMARNFGGSLYAMGANQEILYAMNLAALYFSTPLNPDFSLPAKKMFYLMSCKMMGVTPQRNIALQDIDFPTITTKREPTTIPDSMCKALQKISSGVISNARVAPVEEEEGDDIDEMSDEEKFDDAMIDAATGDNVRKIKLTRLAAGSNEGGKLLQESKEDKTLFVVIEVDIKGFDELVTEFHLYNGRLVVLTPQGASEKKDFASTVEDMINSAGLEGFTHRKLQFTKGDI